MSGPGKVQRLEGNQMLAVAPQETVWLSASAGTGKTQVLSSRVLRLLLQEHVDPSQILCLTFTKAGATEMAARIRQRLAGWVRARPGDLAKELQAIGADFGPATQARARALFAMVLDCPGGGLRIDTIHAFSQWLLAAFPQEANLIPGSRPMEDRERTVLARQVLADLLVAAEEDPMVDPQLLGAAADLSLRMGPDKVEGFLLRCAGARDAWLGPGGWQAPDMRANLLRLFGLPADADDDSIAALCGDRAFDIESLSRCMEINAGWKVKTGQKAAGAIAAWLKMTDGERADAIDTLAGVFLAKTGRPRSFASQEKIDPAYGDHAHRCIESISAVTERKTLLALVERLVPALRLGRAFAVAWEQAKAREGLIDFDDQIRQAATLLGDSAMAGWIRYKLDRQFDHILVDEAQDTNQAQWDIIDALTGEFFAGQGQRGQTMRTLFVVGDYKQAIYRFQGTSPENFRKALVRIRGQMAGAAENARTLRSNMHIGELREYGLDRSFRTAQPVLDFVDRAIALIGHQAFGLDAAPDPHKGWTRPGHVALWQPVGLAGGGEDADDEPDIDPAEDAPDWLAKPERTMAENIARQVRAWLDPAGPGFRLEKEGRRVRAGDVMVLVRKRRALAGLIVARLHAHGVPVAGVDRLRIGEPLAVRDLLAALRFAVQPLDDLNLASLLVSPLIGWSQEDLLRFAYRERHVPLWRHLDALRDADAAPALDQLRDLLRIADFDPPHHLLTWLLTGPWQGRRKLVARLGREANDPIDELVNAAHAYVVTGTPGLAGFLHWFDAGEGELKREADNADGLVRVMTVHGSKGLQAPIVILADAAGDPGSGPSGGFAMPDPAAPDQRSIPLPDLAKEEKAAGPIAAHFAGEAVLELQEHWRLLYVAMTRTEEALFIGGALSSRDKGQVPAGSWYARLAEAFPDGVQVPDPIWGSRLDWGDPIAPMPAEPGRGELDLDEPLAPWLTRAPPADPRPPRPLAPSQLGEDETPDPPFPPGAGKLAARRGTLIHKLLERLPDMPPAQRKEAATAWLARNAADFDEAGREAMAGDVLRILDEPRWVGLFSSASLAEVPVVANLGEQVLAGTIDRLLIEDERVLVVDFKTARRPPVDLAGVPKPILRQMAAYVAALERAFPGRRVEAALLYTAGPHLIELPGETIARNKPDFAGAQ